MGEFCSGMNAYVHSKGLILTGSISPGDYVWFANNLDELGGEVTDNAESFSRAYARRTLSYGKPWSNLFVTHNSGAASASQVLGYLQQALLLGYFPGFNGNYWDDSSAYERDRSTFKQYIPLIQKEAAAGWQPVTYADASVSAVYVERFGSPSAGKFYISAQNTGSSTSSTQFTIDGAGLGISTSTAVTVKELLSNSALSVTRSGSNILFSDSLSSNEAALYQVTVSGPTGVPVASFTVVPACQTCKNTMQFTDTSTNSPTSWSWNFGDGGTSTQQNPAHYFAADGHYTVSLTATNSSGSGSTSQVVIITTGSTSIPTASFTFAPACQTCKNTMQFTDTSTNSPTSWSWTFGDGGASTQQNPSHYFAASGSYTVSLRATNSAGSSSTSRTVTISLAPVASFTVAPACQTCKNSMQFTDTSTNSPTSWSWNFGDGGTSTLRNPGHSFAFGTYTVRLTAANAAGSSTYSKTVVISP
jgi:PKD repeat protein